MQKQLILEIDQYADWLLLLQFIDRLRIKIVEPSQEINIVRNYNAERLRHAFLKAQSLQIFRQISDSVEWQKQQRNEWE